MNKNWFSYNIREMKTVKRGIDFLGRVFGRRISKET